MVLQCFAELDLLAGVETRLRLLVFQFCTQSRGSSSSDGLDNLKALLQTCQSKLVCEWRRVDARI